jgi:hypothetical protein
MSWYKLTLKVGDDVISMELNEEPRSNVLHTWSKSLDPDLDVRSQVTGLLQEILKDLKATFERFRIQIKSIDLNQAHVPLFNASGLMCKELAESRGRMFLNTRPGGLDEREASHELTRFDNVTIKTEGTPRF